MNVSLPPDGNDGPHVSDGLRRAVQQSLQQGDIDGAVEAYEKALLRDPNNVAVRAEFGFFLWRIYAFARGRQVFADVVADHRSDLSLVKAIGRRLFQAGMYREAVLTMQVAVDRAPDDLEARELYAGTLERDDQLERARQEADVILARQPDSVRAARLLAHLDKRMGAYDAAAARLQLQLASFASADDWRLRYELAGVLDRLERYDAAWQQLILAKQQLAPGTRAHLQNSYVIRQRQWSLLKLVTEADLRRWREAAELVHTRRIALMAGFPRSGTTLLEQMLAGHPSCVGTDESGILATQFISPLCWHGGAMEDAIVELRGFEQEQLLVGREAYFRMTEESLGESIGDRLLVDKDPMMTPDLAFPLRLLPESFVLMPLRDPRDVVVSYFFTMVPLNWVSASSTTPADACRFYHDCMRHWLIVRQQQTFPWHEVRYEELVRDPERTLREVCTFLGLDWNPAVLDQQLRAARTAVRTPTYDDITKPVTERAVGRWKNYQRYLEPVWEPLQPFLRTWGYE